MTDTTEYLSRDLAALEQRELTSLMLDDFRQVGVEFVLPNIFTDNDCHTVFHNRIQRIQDLPDLQPEKIESKLISGLESMYPDKDIQDDLDKLFNVRKTGLLKGETLNEVGLTKIEQVLLARGICIAATSRKDSFIRADKEPSQTQIKLEKAALNFINHTRTNFVHIPNNGNERDHNKFVSAYTAAYIAEIVYRELEPQNQYSTQSITEAMRLPIKFGAVLSGDSETRLSVFAEGDIDRDSDVNITHFEKRHPSEIDENRIKELRKLQFRFGDEHSRFTYYETTSAFRKNSKGGGKIVELAIGEKQAQPQERYTVLVIDQPDESGRVMRHAVAENKQVNNALYGLRQEVLDEWEQLIGVRLTWQDIYTPLRMISRQIGARVFTHAKNSDVSRRLLDYLNQDADSVVYETFSRLFDADPENELFDDSMNPTDKNIMPKYFIEAIQKSTELQQLWPVIRKHGYSNTYRLFRNIQITEEKKRITTRTDTARKVSLIDRAMEIFVAAAKADADKTNS